jgi:hypothetical protein
MNDAYDIFDDYIAENSTMDFIKVIMSIYQASGLMPKNEAEAKND